MSILRQFRTLSLLVVGCVGLSHLHAAPLKPETPESLLASAAAAEKKQEWNKALEQYLKAFLAGRQAPEVRERIRVCQQRLTQVQRQRDSLFQQHLATLPVADALNLYSEVLERLSTLYVDPEKVRPEQLFRSGLDELDRALQDSMFQRTQLVNPTDAKTTAARKLLKEWHAKPPKTIREMRAVAHEVVRSLQKPLEVRNPSAIVFELLCGASNSLDEHSIYLSPTHASESNASGDTVEEVSMLSMKDAVGYIKVAAFSERTPSELDQAILRLRDQGLRSLILDLRGNTGGNFLAGIQTAQRFIPSGPIVTTQSQLPEFSNRVFSSDSGMMALDVPLVLLIDTKTMSSAEVVARALKEHQRAAVVGMPSFGKGVLQYPFKLSAADVPEMSGSIHSRSGTLVITIAKLLSTRGTPIHGQGVLPDILESDTTRQLTLALERATALAGMR